MGHTRCSLRKVLFIIEALLNSAPAQASPGLAKDIIWWGETMFTGPIFPPAESPQSWSQIGVIVHELAHLVSERIKDPAHYSKSLRMLPFRALFNADNYRLAVQAASMGLTAPDLLAGRPPNSAVTGF